ncbi:Tenascin-X-like, partial [Homarus americanus]
MPPHQLCLLMVALTTLVVIIHASEEQILRKHRPREGDRCARGSGECKRSCTEPIRGVRECGRDLICCREDNTDCEISKKCLKYDGECKAKCQGDERHIDDMCKDDDCKCCAAPCKLTEQCRAARGRCVSDKDECDGGTVFKGGCEGRHCYCCVTKPPNNCEISKKCLKYDGECKAKCQGDERHIDDMCKDDDCKCCAAPCKLTEQCRAARGRCVSDKDECDGGTVFKGGCEGRHCYCCVTKSMTGCCTLMAKTDTTSVRQSPVSTVDGSQQMSTAILNVVSLRGSSTAMGILLSTGVIYLSALEDDGLTEAKLVDLSDDDGGNSNNNNNNNYN